MGTPNWLRPSLFAASLILGSAGCQWALNFDRTPLQDAEEQGASDADTPAPPDQEATPGEGTDAGNDSGDPNRQPDAGKEGADTDAGDADAGDGDFGTDASFDPNLAP